VRSAGGDVSIQDSIFNAWDAAKTGRYSVEVTGGSIQLIGNDWQAYLPQVSIGPNVDRAVIAGNLITGTERINVQGSGQIIQQGLNAAQ
jgi:hypothetical protein